MKKFIMLSAVVFMTAMLAGCCCSKQECPSGKKCTKHVKCDRPCAQKKNTKACPFLGKWEFFVVKGDKLEALPVSPQPYMEFCKGGILRFHYSKKDKPMVVEGRWKVENGVIVVSDKSGKRVQRYTITADGSAEFTVGKNDRLPANTKVVICRKK